PRAHPITLPIPRIRDIPAHPGVSIYIAMPEGWVEPNRHHRTSTGCALRGDVAMGRAALVAVVVLILAGAGLLALSWESPLAEVNPPSPNSFTKDHIRRGEQLAAIGNCAVCHTAPGGALNAGARPLPTPFGIIHTTNITPDADTGIGRWSLDAFKRA